MSHKNFEKDVGVIGMNSIRVNTRFIEKVLQIAKAQHHRSNQCIITPFSLFWISCYERYVWIKAVAGVVPSS